MTEAYTARASTREQIKIAIRTIQLDTNASGQYKHDDVLVFIKGVTRSLGELYNEADPGNGMKKLLDESSNGTNTIRSTDVVTVETVLAESKAAALAISPATLPTITTRQDAQEAADRQNIRNQAVIGAKEGTAAAITEKVGAATLPTSPSGAPTASTSSRLTTTSSATSSRPSSAEPIARQRPRYSTNS